MFNSLLVTPFSLFVGVSLARNTAYASHDMSWMPTHTRRAAVETFGGIRDLMPQRQRASGVSRGALAVDVDHVDERGSRTRVKFDGLLAEPLLSLDVHEDLIDVKCIPCDSAVVCLSLQCASVEAAHSLLGVLRNATITNVAGSAIAWPGMTGCTNVASGAEQDGLVYGRIESCDLVLSTILLRVTRTSFAALFARHDFYFNYEPWSLRGEENEMERSGRDSMSSEMRKRGVCASDEYLDINCDATLAELSFNKAQNDIVLFHNNWFDIRCEKCWASLQLGVVFQQRASISGGAFSFPEVQLDYLRATFSGKAFATATLRATLSAAYQWSNTTTVLPKTPIGIPIRFTVAFVPIVLTPSFQVDLSYDVKFAIRGDASASATFTSTVTTGIEYKKSHWLPIHEVTTEKKFDINAKVYGEASARVTTHLIPIIDSSVSFGIAKIEVPVSVALEPFVRVATQFGTTLPAALCPSNVGLAYQTTWGIDATLTVDEATLTPAAIFKPTTKPTTSSLGGLLPFEFTFPIVKESPFECRLCSGTFCSSPGWYLY